MTMKSPDNSAFSALTVGARRILVRPLADLLDDL
jgi:hypothetical protein